jgi:geranylgeranyl diphosphate synthase type I
MLLDDFFQTYLPIIEDQLKAAVNTIDKPYLAELRNMLQYHMGWEGDGAGPEARGKRIRPILVLLTTMAAGGEWQTPCQLRVQLS